LTRTNHLTVQAQIALYAALHRVTSGDITGESKAQRCVIPRKHCFLALVCEVIGHKADGTPIYRSLPQIARYFSDRDHTTVLYGVRSIASSFTARRARPRLPKSAKPFRFTWIARGRWQHDFAGSPLPLA
jgi:chromosomal replication initiation ATPase DnaA